MTRVAIDDQISEVGSEAKRVGEVLNALMVQIPPNRIVTKVLLDGRPIGTQDGEEPLNQLDEAIGSVEALEIQTVDREIWAINGLDVAISSAERVQRSLIRSAELFREEDKGEANRYFVHCVDGLERFYEAITISRAVLAIDFRKVEAEGITLFQLEHEFSSILRTIIEFQEAKDYFSLADRIEFALLPNLSHWSRFLRQMRISQQSNA